MLERVQTDKAPQAFSHYSQAVVFDKRLIFLSAQVGMKLGSFELVSNDVLEQAREIFKNIKVILEEANSNIKNVMKVEIFLTNMSYFAAVNELYAEFFNDEVMPARQTIEVSRLPRGASISVSCIAHVNEAHGGYDLPLSI